MALPNLPLLVILNRRIINLISNDSDKLLKHPHGTERNRVCQRLPLRRGDHLFAIHLTQLLTNCSRGERHEKWPGPLVMAIDESRKMCQISVTNRRPNTPHFQRPHHKIYTQNALSQSATGRRRQKYYHNHRGAQGRGG